MSTLKVDTIRDNGSGFNDVVTFANSGGTENGKLCRAFVNFDGTGTVAIRANFNVNSITDNAQGDYTVNFSNALSDANYAVTHAGGIQAAEWGIHLRHGSVAPTTSAYRFKNVTPADADRDVAFICLLFVR